MATVILCDRCKVKADDSYGRVATVRMLDTYNVEGGDGNLLNGHAADLCAGCFATILKAFKEWLRGN